MSEKNKVIPMFRAPELPELPLDVSHLRPVDDFFYERAPGTVIDLTGKRRIVLCVGAGSTGKTTFLRWACEKHVGEDLVLATCDPVNRELSHYFEGVLSPGAADTANWLSMFLSSLIGSGHSAAIDFGGGDTALVRLIRQMPDTVELLAEAGIETVLLGMLSPRVSDLTALAALEDAGLRVPATGLVLNLGRLDAGRDWETEFGLLRRHSVYRGILERGGVEIWMPRLHAARAVEDRRLGFAAAVKGGKGLDPFDRSRVADWLGKMDRSFGQIQSWLP